MRMKATGGPATNDISTPEQVDRQMLDLAARLGWRAAGDTSPNPMVGAVLAKGSRVIGMGHHHKFGEAHAEVRAIADCRARGENPRGATLYVTLEPCAHTGKQPPCVDAIVEAGIAEVVCALRDPNPVAAGGAVQLEKAGIRFRTTEVSPAACALGAPFVKRIRTGLPWVIAKWAQTIDGRIATRSGESRWISCDRSRRKVHRLRSRVDAILTGIGTVLADNPLLTAREVRRVRRKAMRVVADTDLDIPETSQIVSTAKQNPTIVACSEELATAEISAPRRDRLEAAGVRVIGVPLRGTGLDVRALLARLSADFGIANVLIEAGPGLLGAVLNDDLADELYVYIAPLLLGDELARSVAAGRIAPSLSGAQRYEVAHSQQIENDLEVIYRRKS